MELRNYRKFRHSAIEFPDGVIGIIGPNGVGKSTLIEAISWALYGNDAQRTSKEEVRWSGASPGEVCSVLLEFDLDGDHYRVHREMKGKDLKMKASLEVNKHLHADGDRAVNQALSERLGMDYKAFFISVFAKQKDLDALSVLPPGERRQLILRMLEIDVLDTIVSSIRGERTGLENQIKAYSDFLLNGEGRERADILHEEIVKIGRLVGEFERDLEGLRTQREEVEKQISMAKGEVDSLASVEKEHHRIQRELASRRSSLKGLEDRMEAIISEKKSLEDLEGEVEVLKKKSEHLEELLSKKEDMEKVRSTYTEMRSIQNRLAKLTERMPSLERRLGDADEAISKIGSPGDSMRTVTESIAEVDSSIDRIKGRISELNAEIRGKVNERGRLSSKRTEIERLGPESSCPTCERELGEQHPFLIDKMAREIGEAEAEISELEGARARLEEDLEREIRRKGVLAKRQEKLQEALVELAGLNESRRGAEANLENIRVEISGLETRLEEIGKVDFEEERYEEVKKGIDDLRSPARRYVEICGKLERLPRLSQEIVDVENRASKLREEIESLSTKLGSLNYDGERLAVVRMEYEELLSSRDEVSRKTAELKSEVRVLGARIESIESEIRALVERRGQKDKCEDKVATLSVLAKLMGDFKSNLISRIVPTLSEISSSLFNEMTDSKYGGMEIDGDYNVFIYDGGEKYRIERFSGGEGDLANLCLRLSISRVIADRSGSSVDFLILDEIFGSQDQIRKRNILSTLNRLSNKFKQIVLITHIDDVKDFMGNVIYVKEGEDGSSELVMET